LEKVESESSPSTTPAFLEKHPQPATIIEQSASQQQQQEIMVIDVYGKQIESICSYRTCHHKLSVHGYGGNHSCKCRHPVNYATGVSLWPLTKEARQREVWDDKSSVINKKEGE
jgi:hypothetical protein